MQRVNICAALLFASGAVLAQTAPATPTFVVASIKASAPPETSMGPGGGMRIGIRMGIRGGPGTADPGQINYNGMSIKGLLVNAYGVKPYQVTGPDWIDQQRFDIVAKIPEGATKDDVKLMMQNLLAERFKVTIHREKKDLPMYALVIGKNGPKLKESPPDDPNAKDARDGKDPKDAPPMPQSGGGSGNAMIRMNPAGPGGPGRGMPPLPSSGMRMMMENGRMRLESSKQTMAQLADTLTNQMDRPVVDQTGLTKNYDITLEFSPERGGMPGGVMMMPPGGGGGAGGGGGGDGAAPPSASEPAPTLAAAVQEQLGLKLEQKKGAVDLIVVDHAEKSPTEN